MRKRVIALKSGFLKSFFVTRSFLPRTRLFWISQKTHPIIVYCLQMTDLNAFAVQVLKELYIKLFTSGRITMADYYQPFI